VTSGSDPWTLAADPAHRRGVLITSSGGPAAHLSDAATYSRRLPASILDEYDVVSFDQRGFGTSAPVDCGLRPDQQYGIPWPRQGGDEGLADDARAIARQCAQWAGEELPFLGTANVARDVDRIRQALGVDTVSFLGVSYGTYLGTAYDMLFPGRVRLMLLDSSVDAPVAWRGVWRTSLTDGVETRIADFGAFASGAQSQYHLGATAAEVRATVLALIAEADRLPLVTPAGTIRGTQVRIAMFGAMYNDAAFPLFAGLLDAVRDRDVAAAAR
jgi:pimeloyl-ACP methyl ester carboxylesterase